VITLAVDSEPASALQLLVIGGRRVVCEDSIQHEDGRESIMGRSEV